MKLYSEILRLLDSYSESLSFLNALNKIKCALAKTVEYVDFVDKKVDNIIDSGGSDIVIDDVLSVTSENPVQNKIITSAIRELENDIIEIDTKFDDEMATITATVQDSENNIDVLGNRLENAESEILSFNNTKLDKSGHVANKNLTTDSTGNIVFTNMPEGGGSVTIDSGLSTSSENPVQNKVITNRINTLESGLNNKASQSSLNTLSGKVTANENDIDLLEASVTALNTNKADKSELLNKLNRVGWECNKVLVTNANGEVIAVDLTGGGDRIVTGYVTGTEIGTNGIATGLTNIKLLCCFGVTSNTTGITGMMYDNTGETPVWRTNAINKASYSTTAYSSDVAMGTIENGNYSHTKTESYYKFGSYYVYWIAVGN